MLTDKQLAIIKSAPRNPCTNCDAQTYCCGCPEKREFDKKMAEVPGLEHIAFNYRAYLDLKQQFKALAERLDQVIDALNMADPRLLEP